MALDPAIFAFVVGGLAKFDEVVLPGEALPALDSNRRGIDAAGRQLRRAGGRRGGRSVRRANAGRIAGLASDKTAHILAGAVGSSAVNRAGYAQVRGHGDDFRSVGQVLANGGASARRIASRTAGRRAVGGSADVIHYVGARVLVTGHVGFHRVPTEQRERLVEIGRTGEVRD